jgi:hypothetical protein
MAAMSPVHSSHDYEESDPKYHNNNDCSHYKELVKNNHVAPGTGNHLVCDWCAKN